MSFPRGFVDLTPLWFDDTMPLFESVVGVDGGSGKWKRHKWKPQLM